jgi:hypothetical protein
LNKWIPAHVRTNEQRISKQCPFLLKQHGTVRAHSALEAPKNLISVEVRQQDAYFARDANRVEWFVAPSFLLFHNKEAISYNKRTHQAPPAVIGPAMGGPVRAQSLLEIPPHGIIFAKRCFCGGQAR